MNIIRLILLLLICSTYFTSANAQLPTSSVGDIKIYNQDTILMLEFGINSTNPNTFVDVEIKIFDSSTYKITVPKIDKSALQNIKAGEVQRFSISYTKNQLSKLSTYGAVIKIVDSYQLNENKGNAVLKSVVIPGWGDRGLYRGGNSVGTLVTVASYGCIAYGVYSSISASQNYDSYKKALLQTDIDTYYNKVKSQQSSALIFTTIGAGIWALDVLHVAIRKPKYGAKRGISSKPSSKLSYCFIPTNSQLFLNLNYTF